MTVTHLATALQAALYFSAGVGAKTLYDQWTAVRRKG